MKNDWMWIGKYLIVIVVALILGSVLPELQPLKSTSLGAVRIGAGALVEFTAHAGALALLWALGYRLSMQLRRVSGPAGLLSAWELALVTLVVVAIAYGVLLQFIAPLLSSPWKTAVDWGFITGIVASALWLLWAVFTDSEARITKVARAIKRKRAEQFPAADQTA